MTYILTLDQGTTSSRAILFDKSGNVCAIARQEFPQMFTQAGWVEHRPADIWQSQREVMQRVIGEHGTKIEEVAAIGITNQRETVVVWDRRNGQPIYNAIVWQDRRTAERCEALRDQGMADLIAQRTGLVIDAYFSATKIEWILNNVDGARELAEDGHLACGTIDSFLLWKLTGGTVHATDASNAARTMLCNINDASWDAELLKIFSIPLSMLPEIRNSSDDFGELVPNLLGRAVPITGIAGDQQAALFGQACFEPGMAKNTYGTGCFLLMMTGDQRIVSQNNLLTTIAWQIDGKIAYALEGSVFVGGAVVQWLRDGLGIIEKSSDVESLARSVPDSGGVVMVPAFTGLGAPYWDPYARGMIHGLNRGSTAGHLARAALDSIAHQSADVLEAMSADADIPLEVIRVDGGASANELLMQIQTDLLGVAVERPQVKETTALGAAFLAGLKVGFWEDLTDIASCRATEKLFVPNTSENFVGIRREWRKAVSRSKNWISGENA